MKIGRLLARAVIGGLFVWLFVGPGGRWRVRTPDFDTTRRG